MVCWVDLCRGWRVRAPVIFPTVSNCCCDTKIELVGSIDPNRTWKKCTINLGRAALSFA